MLNPRVLRTTLAGFENTSDELFRRVGEHLRGQRHGLGIEAGSALLDHSMKQRKPLRITGFAQTVPQDDEIVFVPQQIAESTHLSGQLSDHVRSTVVNQSQLSPEPLHPLAQNMHRSGTVRSNPCTGLACFFIRAANSPIRAFKAAPNRFPIELGRPVYQRALNAFKFPQRNRKIFIRFSAGTAYGFSCLLQERCRGLVEKLGDLPHRVQRGKADFQIARLRKGPCGVPKALFLCGCTSPAACGKMQQGQKGAQSLDPGAGLVNVARFQLANGCANFRRGYFVKLGTQLAFRIQATGHRGNLCETDRCKYDAPLPRGRQACDKPVHSCQGECRLVMRLRSSYPFRPIHPQILPTHMRRRPARPVPPPSRRFGAGDKPGALPGAAGEPPAGKLRLVPVATQAAPRSHFSEKHQ